MSDRRLVNRIMDMIKSVPLKTSDNISENLRKKFPEYQRKDRNALKKLIQQHLDTFNSAKEAVKEEKNESIKKDLGKESSSKKRDSTKDDDTTDATNGDDETMSDVNEEDFDSKSGVKRKRKNSDKISEKISLEKEDDSMSGMPTIFTDDRRPVKMARGNDKAAIARCSSINRSLNNLYSNNGDQKKDSNSKDSANPVVSKDGSKRSLGSKGVYMGTNGSGSAHTAWNPAECEVTDTDNVTLDSMGGVEKVQTEIRDLILYPLQHGHLYRHIGTEPPTGVLLHGPPGSGKSMLATAIAGSLLKKGIATFRVVGTELISGMSGESESKMRLLFEEVKKRAPCLLFFDEIDAITPKREQSERQMDRRLVAQFGTCLDSLRGKDVIVLGATNRGDGIDSSLRRAGRFDREICMGIPDLPARERMLKVITKDMKLNHDVSLKQLAQITPGYVGADLVSLTQEAALHCVQTFFTGKEKDTKAENDTESKKATDSKTVDQTKMDVDTTTTETNEEAKTDSNEEKTKESEKTDTESDKKDDSTSIRKQGESEKTVNKEHSPDQDFMRDFKITEKEMEELAVSQLDFNAARKKVQPSSQREGFTTSPNVSWDDIGALGKLREEMELAIIQPVKNQELFQKVGLTTPAGVLLFGPPGCGKTLLAKAVANASDANFISVKGPELLNKYVGESERAVRTVFQRAAMSAPCIIFFDELDSMVPKRSSESNSSSERVVNQMLTELDGMTSRRDVFVVAATNRPDIIDPAMLRPGRLDRLLYVPLPDEAGRREILQSLTRKIAVLDRTNGRDQRMFDMIAARTEGFTGADLGSLVREATVTGMRQYLMKCGVIKSSENGDIKSSDNLENGSSEAAAAPASTLEISITEEHFLSALKKMKPSVTEQQQREYKLLAEKVASEQSKGS